MEGFIFSGIAGVIGAAIGASASIWAATKARESAKEASSATRQSEFEKLLDSHRLSLQRAQNREHLLFLWNRELIDHIYQGKPPPPPNPPDGLLDS